MRTAQISNAASMPSAWAVGRAPRQRRHDPRKPPGAAALPSYRRAAALALAGSRAGAGFAAAGEPDQRLHQPGDALEALALVGPVAQVDKLVVGTQAQRAGVALDQF